MWTCVTLFLLSFYLEFVKKEMYLKRVKYNSCGKKINKLSFPFIRLFIIKPNFKEKNVLISKSQQIKHSIEYCLASQTELHYRFFYRVNTTSLSAARTTTTTRYRTVNVKTHNTVLIQMHNIHIFIVQITVSPK